MPKNSKTNSLESLQAELEKAERKKKYYEQQEKILTRKVIPKLTRAERTNRLCTRAGMLESFLVHPELLSNDQVMDLLKIAFRQKEVKEGKTAEASVKREEVTIKFGKGLAEPFQSKDGREFMRISIPNQDPADKTPWASFVLPAKAVHENQYDKGLWAKIPADGTTVVTKPVLKGQDEQGKNIWEDQKTSVPNPELKSMVEAYKTRAPQARESARGETRCPRKGHSIEAHSGEDSESKVENQERSGTVSQRGGESCLGTYFFSWYHGTYHVRKNCVLDLKIGHGIISVPTRYPAWED